MAAVTVCSQAVCKAQTVRVSAKRPIASVAALPRVATAMGAAAAAALLTATPALAGDLTLGQQVFDNNCGGLLCLSSSSSLSSSSAAAAPGSASRKSHRDGSDGGSGFHSDKQPAPAVAEEHGSGGIASRDPLSGPSSSPPGGSAAPTAPWQRGGRAGRALLRQPLLRLRQPASLMLMQAACHMGGQNSVQPEKTLQKAALEQYLAGGFSVDSIITQVENGKGAMPAWAGRLDSDEIESVAEYVFQQAEGNLW